MIKQKIPTLLLLTISLWIIPQTSHAQVEEEHLERIRQATFDTIIRYETEGTTYESGDVTPLVDVAEEIFKSNLEETRNLQVIVLYARIMSGAASEATIDAGGNIVETTEQLTVGMHKALTQWIQYPEVDWIETIAKIGDSIITGCLRNAIQSGTDFTQLSRSIAYGSASPFMKHKGIDHQILVKIAKGINFGIPYKFIDSIIRDAPKGKQPSLIEKISLNTAYGTIASAVQSNIEHDTIVNAATDAFSSSVITISAKHKLGIERIATLTKHASKGIMVGAVNAATENSLPVGEMGAVIISEFSGDVTLKRTQAEENMADIKIGSHIHQDYVVKTGKESKITLLFSNGSLITLQPDSQLLIDRYSQQKFESDNNSYADLIREPSVSHTKLKLSYGDIIFSVKPLLPDSKFYLETPVGTTILHQNTEDNETAYNNMLPMSFPYALTQIPLNIITAQANNVPTRGNMVIQQNSDGTYSGNSSFATGVGTFKSPNGVTSPIPTGSSIFANANSSGRAIGTPRSDVTPPSVANVVNATTTSQLQSAASTTLTSVSQLITTIETNAQTEVTTTVGATARIVAKGIGSAGVDAIRANGIQGDTGIINQANAEGTATGSLVSASSKGLAVANIAYDIAFGTANGSGGKTLQLGQSLEALISDITNGHGDSLSEIITLGLFSDEMIKLIEQKLEEGRNDGFGRAIEGDSDVITEYFDVLNEELLNTPNIFIEQDLKTLFGTPDTTTTTTTTTTTETIIAPPSSGPVTTI